MCELGSMVIFALMDVHLNARAFNPYILYILCTDMCTVFV